MTTITQLEKAEEITDNMELAVDTITATQSVTVKELADYNAGLDQDVSGAKTFEKVSQFKENIHIINKNATKGTIPETTTYNGIEFRDDGESTVWQDRRFGVIESVVNANGSVSLQLAAYKPEKGVSTNSTLMITYDQNNKAYVTVPTPDSTDNSTKAANTSWVISRINNVMNNSTMSSNYVVYNNLILQWGNRTDYANGTKTVTFNKPFSSAPTVTCGRVNTYTSSSGGRVTSVYSQPGTASFQYYVYNQTEGGYFMWFAIGK